MATIEHESAPSYESEPAEENPRHLSLVPPSPILPEEVQITPLVETYVPTLEELLITLDEGNWPNMTHDELIAVHDALQRYTGIMHQQLHDASVGLHGATEKKIWLHGLIRDRRPE